MTVDQAAPSRSAPTSGAWRHTAKLFSGTAHRELSGEIAEHLGIGLGEVHIQRFSDGEIFVRIQESVRGDDVFLVQPTCGPVNDNLMELLIMLDACKRASARQITAVIPYFGYARQDRKTMGREAITAKLVADLLTSAGATRVLSLDLHAGQIQGFFNILMDNMYASPVLLDYVIKKRLEDIVVVSPDTGGVARARGYARKLDAPIAIIDKRRPKPNVAEVFHVIGEVAGKTAIMVDDMVDTAGTITAGAKLLMDQGAKAVYAMAAHGVLSGPAIQRLQDSPLEELVITNSIPQPPEKRIPKLKVLSVGKLLADAIDRIHNDVSISELFD